MQALATETKTTTKTETAKEAKEMLQKRRNLFGLGLTSLIAACSGADKAAGGGDPAPLPFKAEKAEKATEDAEKATEDAEKAAELSGTKADGKSGFTTTRRGNDGQFTFEIKEAGETKANLIFTDGKADGNNRGYIYKLTATDTQHDLVVSSPTIDTESGSEYRKGRIFIFWNVAGIEDETISKASETTTKPRLEIKGAARADNIGIHAPEFLQIGGTDNNYDMVIRSQSVDDGSVENEGAIYILWDVADYAGEHKTITLDNDLTGEATAGSLAIYGTTSYDSIGTFAPEFLHLDGDAKYDMVIRSYELDKFADIGNSNEGAIYILWDIDQYANGGTETVTLGNASTDIEGTLASGSLAIYGATENDFIGTHAPEFLKIGGEDSYDMVIRSEWVDKEGSGNPATNEGATYILWDVADYTGNKNIDLGDLDGATSMDQRATAGSLAIYGETANDQIGTHAPEFLHLDDDTKYDMLIRSQWANGGGGGIYILWDVADYTGNKTIDLGDLDGATSMDQGATFGSLAIYGATRGTGGTGDEIGIIAPEFLHLDGNTTYDMVIRSDQFGDRYGAIYILWDVADYAGNKTIDLGNRGNTDLEGPGATLGSLEIKGAATKAHIGTHAPEFLHLDGNAKYDMVIRSHEFDKNELNATDEGAIFILWDVDDYADGNKTITLDKDLAGGNATSGSLAIYGAFLADYIGTFAPDFFQIGGAADDNKLDVVIRSHKFNSNKGAIYILWDVADYKEEVTNKSIDLGVTNSSLENYASSGLLTIYGRDFSAYLGSDANNILYNADGELTNIDNDDAGTIDIAFRDNNHTYILFGDKVANDGNDDDKVDSKTIDVAQVNDDGFFNYGGIGDNVGYRFADRKANLAEVQAAYTAANPSGLSDADADLGVWDIA